MIIVGSPIMKAVPSKERQRIELRSKFDAMIVGKLVLSAWKWFSGVMGRGDRLGSCIIGY
jgi:hypothetical protein